MANLREVEDKAKKIEELCEALARCVGKVSLYKQAKDTTRKIEALAGEIRREVHTVVAMEAKPLISWNTPPLWPREKVTAEDLRTHEVVSGEAYAKKAGGETSSLYWGGRRYEYLVGDSTTGDTSALFGNRCWLNGGTFVTYVSPCNVPTYREAITKIGAGKVCIEPDRDAISLHVQGRARDEKVRNLDEFWAAVKEVRS